MARNSANTPPGPGPGPGARAAASGILFGQALPLAPSQNEPGEEPAVTMPAQRSVTSVSRSTTPVPAPILRDPAVRREAERQSQQIAQQLSHIREITHLAQLERVKQEEMANAAQIAGFKKQQEARQLAQVAQLEQQAQQMEQIRQQQAQAAQQMQMEQQAQAQQAHAQQAQQMSAYQYAQQEPAGPLRLSGLRSPTLEQQFAMHRQQAVEQHEAYMAAEQARLAEIQRQREQILQQTKLQILQAQAQAKAGGFFGFLQPVFDQIVREEYSSYGGYGGRPIYAYDLAAAMTAQHAHPVQPPHTYPNVGQPAQMGMGQQTMGPQTMGNAGLHAQYTDRQLRRYYRDLYGSNWGEHVEFVSGMTTSHASQSAYGGHVPGSMGSGGDSEYHSFGSGSNGGSQMGESQMGDPASHGSAKGDSVHGSMRGNRGARGGKGKKRAKHGSEMERGVVSPPTFDGTDLEPFPTLSATVPASFSSRIQDAATAAAATTKSVLDIDTPKKEAVKQQQAQLSSGTGGAIVMSYAAASQPPPAPPQAPTPVKIAEDEDKDKDLAPQLNFPPLPTANPIEATFPQIDPVAAAAEASVACKTKRSEDKARAKAQKAANQNHSVQPTPAIVVKLPSTAPVGVSKLGSAPMSIPKIKTGTSATAKGPIMGPNHGRKPNPNASQFVPQLHTHGSSMGLHTGMGLDAGISMGTPMYGQNVQRPMYTNPIYQYPGSAQSMNAAYSQPSSSVGYGQHGQAQMGQMGYGSPMYPHGYGYDHDMPRMAMQNMREQSISKPMERQKTPPPQIITEEMKEEMPWLMTDYELTGKHNTKLPHEMTPPSVRRARRAQDEADRLAEEAAEAEEQARYDEEEAARVRFLKPLTIEDIEAMQKKDGRHAAIDYLAPDALTNRFWGMNIHTEAEREAELQAIKDRSAVSYREIMKKQREMGLTREDRKAAEKRESGFFDKFSETLAASAKEQAAKEEALKKEVWGPIFPEKYGSPVAENKGKTEHVWKSDETALHDEFDHISTQARHLGVASSPAFPKSAAEFAGIKATSIEIEKRRLESQIAYKEAARSRTTFNDRAAAGNPFLTTGSVGSPFLAKAFGGKVFNDGHMSVLGSPTNTWVAPNASMGPQAPFPTVSDMKNSQAEYNLTFSGRPSRFFPTPKTPNNAQGVKDDAMTALQKMTGKGLDGKPHTLGSLPILNKGRGDDAFLPAKPVPKIVRHMYGDDHLKPTPTMTDEGPKLIPPTGKFGMGTGSAFASVAAPKIGAGADMLAATLARLTTGGLGGLSQMSSRGSVSSTGSFGSRRPFAHQQADAEAEKAKKAAQEKERKAWIRRLVENDDKAKAEHEANCEKYGWGNVPYNSLYVPPEEYMGEDELKEFYASLATKGEGPEAKK